MSGTDQNLLKPCCAEPCNFCESAVTCACSDSSTSSNSVSNEIVKIRYTYDQIHKLFESNSQRLNQYGYDYIVAIGGGGFIPARMLRTFVDVPIIAVTVKYYDDDDNLSSDIKVIQWDTETIATLKGKKCLIVDEVYDTGSTMKYIVDRLLAQGVEDVSALVLHHKIKDSNRDTTTYILEKLQNFHPLVRVTDEWIVYPWEAEDITEHNSMTDGD